MNKHSLQLRGIQVALSVVLLIAFALTATRNARSQNPTYPQVPVLSLTGAEDGYNTDWYPDGRIWLPVSNDEGDLREFLLPVFIDNKWYHYKSTALSKFLVPKPIYSFKFKILYDGVAITPVGIVTTHPFPEDDPRAYNVRGDYMPPLAKDFNIQWDVHKDMSYWEYFSEGTPINPQVRERGRVIVITGTSSKPLPNTDTNTVDFNVLLYVKFRINLVKAKISANQRASLYSPIYISPDTIMYNDWNVRQDIAFKELLYSDSVRISDIYTDPKAPGTYVGLAGMNNKNVSLWQHEPVLPGTIYLSLTEKLPSIYYDISRSGSQPPILDYWNSNGDVPEDLWIMNDPLTVDSSQTDKPDNQYGEVKFVLKNGTTDTRLVDIYLESDAPWLLFMLNSENRSKYVPVGRNTTQGYINYMDNHILGGGANKPDPLGNATEPDALIEITLRCDPTQIAEFNGEKAGIYVGYLTIRSKTAEISPVRLKVTFINFRNPFEPDDGTLVGGQYTKPHRGITLTIRNSAPNPQQTQIVFGTGPRATDGVDSLFGEFAYSSPLAGFGARFYPPDEDFAMQHNIPYGFGDMLPNRDYPATESRDIRDINSKTQSHIFLCRFNADGPEKYPVVISWDTTDFPEGAQLFLSDTLNGALFPSINMRKGTHLYGNVLSYTIEDPNITSFKIEYTIPSTMELLDSKGEPLVKKGWNLLSMPRRPKNSSWDVVYPNAVNRPFSFFNNGYQDEDILKPGVGYFIKYSDSVDKIFKGTFMKRITMEQGDDGFADEVHVFPGWNTIGALSYPMNVSYIDFDPFGGLKPTKSFVRKHGVWGYKTDGGYYETSILEPGLGYWIKVDEGKHGYLKLIHPTVTKLDADYDWAKDNALSAATKLTVRDNAQREANLYVTEDQNLDLEYFELPPVPPAGLFDARFASNRMLERGSSNVIKLQGVEYPIAISFDNADADYALYDAVSGEKLGTVKHGESGSIEIKSTVDNSIRVEKTEAVAGLSARVYPQPAATVANVNYAVPESGNVKLVLVDAMGSTRTLFEGYRSAGVYTYNLNVANLSSGRYFLRLIQGSNVATATVSVVK